jgi:hypothetical protein
MAVPAGSAAFDLAPTDSPNRLDHPIVDLALLDPAGADGAPRLLVVDAVAPVRGTARVALLLRDRAWAEVGAEEIDLRTRPDDEPGTPWLVGLSPTRFALIATSPGTDGTTAVLLGTDGGPGRNELRAIARGHVDVAIDDAGAADVDGDGAPELVLGSARTVRQGWTCQGSRLLILDGGTLGMRAELGVPETRLAGGVIGRFDDVPGDDLLAYGHGNCPAGPDTPGDASLLTVRLADGTVTVRESLRGDSVRWLGSPLRLDVDGTGTNEAVGNGRDGLSVVDPASGWTVTRVAGPSAAAASGAALPLIAAPATGADAGARIAWVDRNSEDVLAAAEVSRASDGSIRIVSAAGLAIDALGGRATSILDQAAAEAQAQAPSAAWIGALGDPACPELILPGARLSCGDDTMTPGAAWIGTRPVTAIGDGLRRRLLVAGGLEWSHEDALPLTPSPWAVAPAGWWRHGPSVPFSLAELRAGDATYFQDFPVPHASLMQTTEADASTTIPGFTGVRIFARITPESEDVDPLAGVQGGDAGVVLIRHWPTDKLTVLRIPVPPGLEAGRDGSGVRLPLDEARFGNGDRADRWSVGLVSVNDWGEVGEPVAGLIVRDAIGPFVTLDPPFATPVWPIPASLPGTIEPGATLEVDGIGSVEADRRGRFTLETPLAPWPQTLRLIATDPSGNETVREVSVVGGVDYRRFPWQVIGAVALLIAVAASGMVGSRWRRAGTPGPSRSPRSARVALYEDGPIAEIEELPPGAGLA